MIAAWMLGATVFALLLGIAAMATARALRATGRAMRTPWVVALTVAVVWPLLAPVVQHYRAQLEVTPVAVVQVGATSPSGMIAEQLPGIPVAWSAVAGTVLLALWGAASLVLLVRMLVAVRTLSRLKREAHRTQLDGHEVLVTEEMGPALVGLLQPSVAVPSWLLQLDAPLRALVLRHEEEHRRSRDPQLVWMAAVSVVLMPWNAGVWWIAHRLRLALEIDCDTRTLRAEPDAQRYGKLLLLIAQRQSGFPLSTMLAERTSHLSRRITAMQTTPLRRPIVQVLLLGGVAAAAIAVACSPRLATDLTAPKTTAAPSLTQSASPGAVFYEFQVEKPVTSVKNNSVWPAYPDSLKSAGIEGAVLAQFVVDEQGVPEAGTLKILKADRPEFEASVRKAVPAMRFEAALLKGKAVKQLVQQPFMFSLGRGSAGGGATTRGNAVAKMVPDKSNPGVLVPTGVPAGEVSATTRNAAATMAPATSPVERSAPQEGKPFFEFQVDKPVAVAAQGAGPVYPPELKARRIEGRILVQFVVDDNGNVELSTYKVLKSDNPEFETAVRDALASMRFTPAQVKGRAVRQLVQYPFQFTLSR